MKRTVAALSFLCLTFALAAPARAAKYKIHWLVGHPSNDYFDDAADYFRETVQKGSGGDIAVDIEWSKYQWEDFGQGTPGPEIAAKVAGGEAQMGHSFTDVMGSLDHRMWAFDLPFLFRDYQHVEQVIEGPVGQELLAGLAEHRLKGLAFTFSGGANVLSTRARAVRAPEDFKGLRVAVFGDEVESLWLKSLGAAPVTINHREDRVADLTEKDAIDSAVLTWRRQHRARLGSSYAYGCIEGLSYLVSVTYVNKEFFDALPERYRSLIVDAAREAARIERADTVDLNEISKRRLLSKGTRESPLTAENRRKFQEALRPVYEGSLNALVGKDLIERIRKTGGADGRLAAVPPGR